MSVPTSPTTCGFTDGEATCNRRPGHDGPHRLYSPSPPFGRWIEYSSEAVEVARGGPWGSEPAAGRHPTYCRRCTEDRYDLPCTLGRSSSADPCPVCGAPWSEHATTPHSRGCPPDDNAAREAAAVALGLELGHTMLAGGPGAPIAGPNTRRIVDKVLDRYLEQAPATQASSEVKLCGERALGCGPCCLAVAHDGKCLCHHYACSGIEVTTELDRGHLERCGAEFRPGASPRGGCILNAGHRALHQDALGAKWATGVVVSPTCGAEFPRSVLVPGEEPLICVLELGHTTDWHSDATDDTGTKWRETRHREGPRARCDRTWGRHGRRCELSSGHAGECGRATVPWLSDEPGRCGDEQTGLGGRRLICTLEAGHGDWHVGGGATWEPKFDQSAPAPSGHQQADDRQAYGRTLGRHTERKDMNMRLLHRLLGHRIEPRVRGHVQGAQYEHYLRCSCGKVWGRKP